jgi:hypothetical protein
MASPRPVPPLALVRPVDLVELLEDGRLMFGRDTGAGIGHTDVEVPVHRLSCYALHPLAIVMFFPALFGPNELTILAAEVLSWPGGVAPAGIQRALRHEIQRAERSHPRSRAAVCALGAKGLTARISAAEPSGLP